MLDRETAIAAWREQLRAARIPADTIEELEAHLRDDIAAQIQSGVDSRTACESAMQKIGKVDMIKVEFQKCSPPLTAQEKLMLATALLGVAFIIFLCSFTVFYCYSGWNQRFAAAVPMLCTILVAWSWTRVAPRLPVVANRRKRITLGVACIASGFVASALFCNFILPYFRTGNDGMIPPAGFWSAFIIACFACLGLALAMDYDARAGLGTAITQHLAARAKNAMLSFAGVPNQYTSFNQSTPGFDSRWTTYSRFAVFVLPTVTLWLLSAVYIVPQFNRLWQKTGNYSASPFGDLVDFNFAVIFLVKDHFFYLLGAMVLAVAFLEWRSRGWPRYRRAVIGVGAFILNMTMVLSFAIMFLGATLTATWLSP